ncbi:GNAT family N-acetyltransferase [Furfurilactobacillus sp. WILCCON 0119]
MGQGELRRATEADLDQIMVIVQAAKQAIARAGFNQWQDGYPMRTDMLADLTAGHLFVLTSADQIMAVAAMIVGEEPNYQLIERGAWLHNGDYATIHRLAVASAFHGQHVGEQLLTHMITWLRQTKPGLSIRVDTHADNVAMQTILTRCGFIACGTIYVDGNAPRCAYEHWLS